MSAPRESYADGWRLGGPFARNRDRAVFITYLMAGDPDPETSLEILRQVAEHADIIELGLPFSDPMAEGPSIQKAAQRALGAGMTTARVLDLVRRFRAFDTVTPIVLMGYLNPIESYGYEAFARDAAAAGADGLIVVDCPAEEGGPLAAALAASKLDLIPLVAPTTDDARLPQVVAHAAADPRGQGFIYYVSVAGVTGVKAAEADRVGPAVARIRRATDLPVAVGFGIRTPEQAAAIARVADGVVIGSALVGEIESAVAQNRPAVPAGVGAAAALGEAIRRARLAPADEEG